MTRRDVKLKCPECGRIGTLRRYTDGSALIIHATKPGLFGFILITDSCFFAHGLPQEKKKEKSQ